MIVRNAGRVRRMWSGGKASLPFCTFAPVGFDFSVQPRVSVKVHVFRGRVFICCSPAYPMTSPITTSARAAVERDTALLHARSRHDEPRSV